MRQVPKAPQSASSLFKNNVNIVIVRHRLLFKFLFLWDGPSSILQCILSEKPIQEWALLRIHLQEAVMMMDQSILTYTHRCHRLQKGAKK